MKKIQNFEESMNLGVGSVVKTMSGASCSVSWKSGGSDKVSDQFPAGLRVLVVDDDPTCLRILEKMLRNCHYEGTKKNHFFMLCRLCVL